MTRPTVGLMAFHKGLAVELLHRISKSPEGQVWRVRAILRPEPAPDYDLLLCPGDTLCRIHSLQR